MVQPTKRNRMMTAKANTPGTSHLHAVALCTASLVLDPITIQRSDWREFVHHCRNRIIFMIFLSWQWIHGALIGSKKSVHMFWASNWDWGRFWRGTHCKMGTWPQCVSLAPHKHLTAFLWGYSWFAEERTVAHKITWTSQSPNKHCFWETNGQQCTGRDWAASQPLYLRWYLGNTQFGVLFHCFKL